MKDQEKKKLYTGERSGVLVVSQGINNHLEIERIWHISELWTHQRQDNLHK